jgi:hypothetical protein
MRVQAVLQFGFCTARKRLAWWPTSQVLRSCIPRKSWRPPTLSMTTVGPRCIASGYGFECLIDSCPLDASKPHGINWAAACSSVELCDALLKPVGAGEDHGIDQVERAGG